MVYNLVITEHAEELVDNILFHIIYRLKNPQAAEHLLIMIGRVYEQLETNPYVYTESRDAYLKSQGYREAIVPEMSYKLVFEVEDKEVTILGIFHQLEDYPRKLQ